MGQGQSSKLYLVFLHPNYYLKIYSFENIQPCKTRCFVPRVDQGHSRSVLLGTGSAGRRFCRTPCCFVPCRHIILPVLPGPKLVKARIDGTISKFPQPVSLQQNILKRSKLHFISLLDENYFFEFFINFMIFLQFYIYMYAYGHC